MEGDRAPLGELIELCGRFGAYLIVDEAHAVGVEGSSGRGLTSEIAGSECLLAAVHTCGKALSSMGAFVTGSATLRQFLINHARTFIFTTALPPYCAAHVREAVALAGAADAERAHLRRLSRHLRDQMRHCGFDTGRSDSQIIPLILGSNETASRFASVLCASGFAVRAIRPPTVPPGTARLRVSINAGLSMAELDAFVAAMVTARETEAVIE
jgi:8-amino-7-oxononanoate synthase